MMLAGAVQGGLLCVAAFVLSVLVTRAAIVYARRRGMLDQPGFRRSHQVPTPRGGGIGIVAGALLAAAVALPYLRDASGAWTAVAVCVAGAAVAVAGWADDHHTMPVLPRLLIQVLASTLFVAVTIHAGGFAWAWLPPGVLLSVWSINLHNFMDGIDGILGAQIVFVGAGLALLAWVCASPVLTIAAGGMAAAAAGFLVYNWPPARVFMGDVGSGFAGFLVFVLIALLCVRVPLALWPALLLCSSFAADAGFTLAWRMWRGKRWYNAHREHVYQWLVRCGWTHAQTVGLYMLWNLLLAAPLAAWATWRPHTGPWLCVALYVVAAGLWWQVRRICVHGVRSRRERHAA